MLLLRTTWIGMQALVLGVFFVLYQRIMAAKSSAGAKATLSVPKKPSLSDPQPQGADTMTVHEYDVAQVKEAVQQTVVQLVLIGVIHVYWAATMPLVTTSVMSLQRLYENKLVKIHFLGATGPDVARPFKADENPFAAFLPKPEPEAPVAAVDNAAPNAAPKNAGASKQTKKQQ
jgi:hypothetical protein